MTLLNDGLPVHVESGSDGEQIGRGPWARWLATAVVPDEGSTRAERGRILARTGNVHGVSVVKAEITALVIGSTGTEYRVGLASDPVAPRVWAAVMGSPRARVLFEPASVGCLQSLQLAHMMTVDWEEPLVPLARSIRRSCTCPDNDRSGGCKHVIALAYVIAAAIDENPAVLLEWRGCTTEEPQEEPRAERLRPLADAWAAGPLPSLDAPRPLPVGSVLKRLGASGLVVDGVDLREILEPAYAAFAGQRS
ncbi:MAG: SWIM zinc finger family protein [Thermoleophilia bacterium]